MEFDTSKIDNFRALMVEKEKELREAGNKAFKEYVKNFFAACPEVQAIVWSQYTPHFEDGEESTFSETTFVFGFDADDLKYPYQYVDAGIGVDLYDCSGKFKPEYKQISDFIQANEDIMLVCFDDNTTVYVTPTEIITEEYEL